MRQSVTFVALTVLIFADRACSSIVVNGGFETVVPIPDPTPLVGSPIPGLGLWHGDPATMVSSENGINPAEGSHMLRFDSGGGSMSNIWQVVTTRVQARGAVVSFVTLFNALGSSGSAELRVASSDALLMPGDSFPNPIAQSELMGLDDNPATWEPLQLDFPVPNESHSLLFMVAGNPGSGVYADAARTGSVPEPVGIVVWSVLATIGFAVYRSGLSRKLR